jgi:hypothetical protein
MATLSMKNPFSADTERVSWKNPRTPRDILGNMPGSFEKRFRLLGLLPLLFFLVQAAHYWRVGGLGNLLWMCNVGNVLLGIGILAQRRELIRAAAIWTVPGLALWVNYIVVHYETVASSVLAHVGALIVGLVALRIVRMDRIAWAYAFLWYLVLQLAARLFTSPDLNVNVAFRIQTGWETTFTSYWKFWVVMTAVVAAGLWVIGLVLSFIWPAEQVLEFQNPER